MADKEKRSGPDGPFDVGNIHQLVRLMRKYDLTAIDLIDDKTRIRLRRRGPEPAPAPTYSSAPPGVVMASSAAAPQAAPASAPPPATAPSSGDIVIESPMVGTYYASPAPDSPPFVGVGSSVRPDSTVCVIEAMKVFTDIPAGVSGTITEVLVKNGQPVEFGQPLFRLKPA